MKTRITKRAVDALKKGDRDTFLWDVGDDSVKGFGVKCTPAGEKSFILQYRMGGRGTPTKRLKIGKYGEITPEEARQQAAEFRRGTRLGDDPMAIRNQRRASTVRKLATLYVADRRDRKRRSADEIERLLNKHVLPAWGDRPLASITAGDVSALVQEIKTAGKPILANRVLAWIKGLFTYAVRGHFVAASPAVAVEMPADETERDRVLSDEELAEVWHAADELGGPFAGATKLLILTLQRRTEVASLKRPEIHMLKRQWDLPADRSKNKQAHLVHLSPQAVAVLESIKALSKEHWFSTDGENPIQGWSQWKETLDAKILERRRTAAEKAGHGKPEPMPHWVFHDLRRTATTRLNELGFPEHVVDLILNHRSKAASSRSTVKKVYNRALYLPERKAAIEAWGRHVEALITGAAAASNVVPLPAKMA
jgi:integrase